MTEKRDKPFRLGTTSFIYPDHILPNVKKLGRFFDEIELLIFESTPEDVLPSKNDVSELLKVSEECSLSYNVHLPTDISLTGHSPEKRQTAADTYARVIERLAPLNPTTHTLHLEMPEALKKGIGQPVNPPDTQQENHLKEWVENTYQGVKALLANGVYPDSLSIETLDYPFRLVDPLVEAFNLPVCMDLGHAVKYGYDMSAVFKAHHSHIPVMHLHGVEVSSKNIKDHTRLDTMPEEQFSTILNILEQYTGVVSLEVFNLKNLNYSLLFLSQFFRGIPAQII